MQHHDVCFYVVSHVFDQRPKRHIAVPLFLEGVPKGFVDKVVTDSLNPGEQVTGKYWLSEEIDGDITIFFVAPSSDEEE